MTIDATTVIHGDCRDLLPGIEAQVIITDPPWPQCPSGLFPSVSDPYALFDQAMLAMPASVERLIVILRGDQDPRFLAPVPKRLPFFRIVVLPYLLPSRIGRRLVSDEVAYWFGSPCDWSTSRRVVPGRAPVAQPSKQRVVHPCARSQVHMDWLVGWATDHGDVVCDPFCGVGSTGVASVRNNRRFVGIEIDRQFADVARVAIAQAECAPTLPWGGAPASSHSGSTATPPASERRHEHGEEDPYLPAPGLPAAGSPTAGRSTSSGRRCGCRRGGGIRE